MVIDEYKFCDGTLGLQNADKIADCEDKSDEDFNTCCTGNNAAYTESICN